LRSQTRSFARWAFPPGFVHAGARRDRGRLFLGKQLGVFRMVWIAVRLGFAQLPSGSRLPTLYGVAVLALTLLRRADSE